jgi:formate hydrogenlyase subunit 3/multisubunit Na+/H+ antiporter MnhD subunit
MTALWVGALLTPLLLAAATLPTTTRQAAMAWAPLACVPALLLAILGSRAGELAVPWLLLGTHLEVDVISRPLLAVTALLYCMALAGSRIERSEDERRASFIAIFLITYLGNITVLVAIDVATFYVGFTVMSLSAYGLVVHRRTDKARYAAKVYIAMAILGEALLLAGLVRGIGATGMFPLDVELADIPTAIASAPGANITVILLIAGLGVKAGLVPLHVWLPLAHPAAPAPASAVLSGAMVKAGLVGWLRLLPLGLLELATIGTVMIGLGLAGVVLGVAAGVAHKDPKVQLAYSTVSQMGFLIVMVGVAIRQPNLAATAVAVAIVYAVMHGLAKGSLFLAVPVWHGAVTTSRRWLTLTGVAVAGLTLAGLPPFGGFVAKYGLKEIGEAAGIPLLVLSLGAVGTTLLMARVLITLASTPTKVHRSLGVLDLSWLVLVISGPFLTWWAATTLGAPTPTTLTETFVAALWPVIVGMLLVLAIFFWLKRGHARGDRDHEGIPVFTVPEGDLVVVLEPLARRSLAGLDAAGRFPGAAAMQVISRTRGWPTRIVHTAEHLTLMHWAVLGPLSLVVLFVVAVALL